MLYFFQALFFGRGALSDLASLGHLSKRERQGAQFEKRRNTKKQLFIAAALLDNNQKQRL